MLGSDAAEAEDIGQQVFLRVWKSADRYEPTAKFTTWLYTITRNLVFNELRRRKHRPTTSLDAAPADGAGGRTPPRGWKISSAPRPTPICSRPNSSRPSPPPSPCCPNSSAWR